MNYHKKPMCFLLKHCLEVVVFLNLLINGESLTDVIIKDSLPFSGYYFPSPAPFIPPKNTSKTKT